MIALRWQSKQRLGRLSMTAILCLFGLAIAKPAHAVTLTPGDVYVGLGSDGSHPYRISHLTSSGSLLERLDRGPGIGFDPAICFDQSSNFYVVTISLTYNVSKFSPTGQLLTNQFGSGFVQPWSCVVDGAGHVFIGQVGVTSNSVLEFDTGGNLIAMFSPAVDAVFPSPGGAQYISMAADQCTLYYTSYGPHIKRYNVCTGMQLPDFAVSPGGQPCLSAKVRPNGEVLAACLPEVDRFSATGGLLQVYSASSIAGPRHQVFGMDLDPDNSSFWTASGNMYRVDIATGTTISSFLPAVAQSITGFAVAGGINVAHKRGLVLTHTVPMGDTVPAHVGGRELDCERRSDLYGRMALAWPTRRWVW